MKRKSFGKRFRLGAILSALVVTAVALMFQVERASAAPSNAIYIAGTNVYASSGATRYYVQSGNGITTTGASADNYNVMYDPATHTLTLKDLNTPSSSGQSGSGTSYPANFTAYVGHDLTIKLEGDNSIGSSGTSQGLYLRAGSKVSVEGTGSLSTSAKSTGISIYSSTTLEINGGNLNVTVRDQGSGSDVSGVAGGSVVLNSGSLNVDAEATYGSSNARGIGSNFTQNGGSASVRAHGRGTSCWGFSASNWNNRAVWNGGDLEVDVAPQTQYNQSSGNKAFNVYPAVNQEAMQALIDAGGVEYKNWSNDTSTIVYRGNVGNVPMNTKPYIKLSTPKLTVIYDPGTQGTWTAADETYSGLNSGDNTPTFGTNSSATTADSHNPGYTFTGWDPQLESTVSANVTYTAQWEAEEYTITYEYDGGTGPTTVNPTTYTVADGVSIANDPTKQGYTFTGWTSDDMTTPITTPSKPVSWSAGDETGDKTFTANWTANTDTPYKVEYYYQENGAYPTTATDSADRTGTTDTTATVTDADKQAARDNYVFDEDADNVLSGTIAGDGSLVLKVYFKQQFTVKYAPGTKGTWSVDDETYTDLSHGDNTPTFGTNSGATTADSHAPGYTFDAWTPVVGPKVNGDKTYTATWTANTDTPYKVEYYYQENGAYPTATDSADRTGTTDTTATVTDEDKTPTEDGYVLDESKADAWSGIIAGDGSLVLKVYFKQQFTVIYAPGDHGTWDAEGETYGGKDYGSARPEPGIDPAADSSHDAGYSFGGWTPTLADTVTKDVTYEANWTANTDTPYKVEYYYQENGAYPTTATSDATRSGTTDTTATVTDADKQTARDNYVFDEDADNVLSGTIAGDGSLVLKVYFKQQFTVKYAPGTKGTWSVDDETYTDLSHGDTTPTFGAESGASTANDHAPGYTFDGWDSELAETVTADTTYTATWTANTDTPYKVEYYYQENGAYPTTATDSADRTGTTDTTATVTDEDKTPTEDGYVLDESKADAWSGTIAGDGSLVLKVYFKQQFTVIYAPGDHGTWTDDEGSVKDIDYNTATPEAPKNPEDDANHDPGYTFLGWDPEVADNVTEDATYTAMWEPIEYTVTWVDEDGTVLGTDTMYYGDMPEYTGDTPTKPADDEYTYTFDGWTPKIVAVTQDATYKAVYARKAIPVDPDPEPEPTPADFFYYCSDGDGSKWVKDSSASLQFTFKRSVDDSVTFSHYTDVKVDGKVIDPSNYTAREGSAIITLKPSFLQTLSVGDHTITCMFDDKNDPSATFTVLDAQGKKVVPETSRKPLLPDTGDPFTVAGLVPGLLAAAGMMGVGLSRKRKEH